jgi:phosphatidylinositol alpha-mannosyltransferase
MKIGIVTEYFYPTIGGITENIYNFALHLLKRSRDFRIITAYRPIPDHVDKEVRRRIIFIGRSMPVAFNGSVGRVSTGTGLTRKMREVLKSEKFDIIHGHSPLFPTLPLIANLQQNAPYVGTFHTCMEGHGFFKFFDPLLTKALSRMAGRIAVSDTCAAENRELFSRHFDVIHNGVDVDWWQTDDPPYAKFNDDKTNILFLGRPDIRNGLDYLIRAFELIKKRCPKTRLIIVGGGPLLKFFKQMVPHDIADDVHFEGNADVTRPRYLKSAHVFCFLPAIASFGITVLEGMASGKAMVVSDIEAFRALVKQDESALLVNPHDENTIADAVCRLVENPELREKLGHNARHTVWPYSWEHITEQHLEYYENILD